MSMISNIVCKTAGVAALSAVTYDAYKIGLAVSKNGTNAGQADLYERVYAAERTTTNVSPVTSAMQKKVAELRMNNPIIPVMNRVKGFVKGVLIGFGNNIIHVALEIGRAHV